MPDESRLATSTVKFEGFVEELFVSTTGASVRTGQPLLRVWIESKEILDRQVDYALALRGTGNLADAERNLRIFDIPEQVFEQIRETGRPVRSITLTAPLSGIVLEKPAIVGMRFAAGDILFKTADLSIVWIMAEISERDLGPLRAGQTANIALAAFSGEEFEGLVDFVYPELDMAARTVKVRIIVPNQDMRLKAGQYADVVIEAPIVGNPVLAVPDSAVIDSGSRQVVFVAREGGVFEPRDVTLGYRGEGYIEIRDGLDEGERIVTAGNFLIDAESNLRAALMAFTAAGTAQ
jgi:Cu(I)/Ag(I) efflux system membrane fusion protein